ncbi:sugar transferase [Halopenitus persicus]|uniref:Sugar transferase involved in LPS biosynthesis (Colanic, teichoic acid) n=1 Tax=Halopenitus persicus TaxID=1048396 RepID=A0A1H3IZ70_9EURY|nr:sugar transferase [Halopenitus persicus]SDY32599.1 Sugar transferase involved in LPS biosynthesis (colanic, teichoic acid) [Halopenitus persicus]
MNGGWRYRISSAAGVAGLTALAVALVNSGPVQTLITSLPVLGRLSVDAPTGAEAVFEVLVTTVVVTAAFLPLYKPRPRRILDTIAITQKRVMVATFALATIGYFDYTYRLPRATLIAVAPVLLAGLPAWFVWIRRRPTSEPERAIIVGDDPAELERLAADVSIPLLGYLCPTSVLLRSPTGPDRGSGADPRPSAAAVADGGMEIAGLQRLGGLSRIEDVLVEYDVDTVVLAFERTDRAEFFGALDACFEHGVAAKVHRDHADAVLTAGDDVGTLVDVEIEPWDVQDYVLKRGFDVAFSLVGLVGLAPVIAAIVVAIKLDDGGSILYKQERTAVFGETFEVYKFRSMVENAEELTGATISDEDAGGVDPRVTRVGRVLRKTHLDEIPQLWSVLKGDMSVVGPRPERPEIDSDIELGVIDWRKRWFVKPGLTGLAQINDVTGTEPQKKIRYDLQYVKQQSLDYDMKLVIRQIWKVGEDVVETIREE